MKTESFIMKSKSDKDQRPIKAFIAEDEPENMFVLTQMIERYTQDVDVVASAATIKDSIEKIKEHRPNLLFLDIGLTDGDSFEILEHIDKIKNYTYEIVFVTAFRDKVINAFKFSALHYLIKPIEKAGLVDAVERYKRLVNFDNKQNRIDVFRERMANANNRIVLQIDGGFNMVNVADILYCETMSNYTRIHLKNETASDKDKFTIAKPLSFYESLLSKFDFFRIHNQYLINMTEVAKFTKKPWQVELKNGKNLPVAERRRNDFLDRINGHSRTS